MSPPKQSRASDSVVAAAVAHPVRHHCLTILTERNASPSQLAREIGVDTETANYHVQRLVRMGVVELVEERPVRGVVEHIYRALRRPLVDAEGYLEMSLDERVEFARHVVQLSFADLSTSIDTKTIGERHDHHVSRFPMLVDEEGWVEATVVMLEALDKLFQVEAASAERLGLEQLQRDAHLAGEGTQDVGIPIRALMFLFEMPRRANGGN